MSATVTRLRYYLGVALLLSACGNQPAGVARHADQPPVAHADAPAYTVSGQVRDSRGVPIDAARVEVFAPGFEGLVVVAGPDGRYQSVNLRGGVQLQASKDGYRAATRGVNGPDEAGIDFILQRSSK